MKTKFFIKTLLFLFFFISVNNCKTTDDQEDETQVPAETIKANRYQIITIDAPGAEYNRDYEIMIDGKKMTGKSVEKDKLTFLVPSDTKLGINSLVISSLNQTIPIEISDLPLSDTPKKIMADYVTALNNYTQNLPANENPTYLKDNINNFKTVFDNANEQDKTKAAKFYEANKELYEFILAPNSLKLADDDPNAQGNEKLLKLKTAMYFMAVCGAALWVLPDPIEKAVAAVGVIICFKKCLDYKEGFVDLKLVILDQFLTSNKSEISFDSGENKILKYSMNRRNVISQDQSNASSFTNFATFFSEFSSLKNFQSRLNDQLTWLNNNIPFCNFKILEHKPLPSSATPAATDINQTIFSRTKFSVASSDVTLENVSFNSAGKINVDLKLKNPNATAPVLTTITADYTDEYNRTSSSFNVKVIPKNTSAIEGTWKMTIIEDEPADQWNIDSYTCPGQREDQYFSGQAVFTKTTMKINITELYRYFKYDANCNIVETKDTSGWQIITANHNNTVESNILKINTGVGNNDDNHNWTFSAGTVTLLDQNTMSIIYSFYDGYETVDMYYKLIRQ